MTVRPIDASRFGEILERWKKDCLEDNDTQGADIISDVILQLDDMPALTPPNEWVSVEERLPAPTENLVLVYDGTGVGINMAWYSYAMGWKYRTGLPGVEITHWMPLPEPPKEETL